MVKTGNGNGEKTRNEIRRYIREERETVLKQWMAMKEQQISEDRARMNFLDGRIREENKSLPLQVQKFLGD